MKEDYHGSFYQLFFIIITVIGLLCQLGLHELCF